MGTPGVSLAVGAEQPAGSFASTGRDAAEELFNACYPRLTGGPGGLPTLTRTPTASLRRRLPGCWAAGPGLTALTATCM